MNALQGSQIIQLRPYAQMIENAKLFLLSKGILETCACQREKKTTTSNHIIFESVVSFCASSNTWG